MSHPVVFFWYADGYLIHVSLSPLIKVASGYWRKIHFLTNQRSENLGELSDLIFFIFIHVIFLRVKSVES